LNTKQGEKKLLRLFGELTAEQRDTVLAFIEFLVSRNPVANHAAGEQAPQIPQPIPRPDKESVVKAIKRLRETYPMLNPDKLVHEISGFMMKHVIHGKPAVEVIDELEVFFARHYESYKDSF